MSVPKTPLFVNGREEDATELVLPKPISAIQMETGSDGTDKLGLITQLSPGTRVRRCGAGFSEKTVKVLAHGKYYMMFSQDLQARA